LQNWEEVKLLLTMLNFLYDNYKPEDVGVIAIISPYKAQVCLEVRTVAPVMFGTPLKHSCWFSFRQPTGVAMAILSHGARTVLPTRYCTTHSLHAYQSLNSLVPRYIVGRNHFCALRICSIVLHIYDKYLEVQVDHIQQQLHKCKHVSHFLEVATVDAYQVFS
jgi:hypothetical protein